MNSERIKLLASCINSNDIVLDVGCDHGYLSIYLKQNNLCKEVYASDISENALNSAINNFKKYNLEIKYYLSDGFKNIPISFNTAVIAGVGTNTILKIINDKKSPNKLILGSNNDYYKLRKELNKIGYKIIKEEVVLENNHYYVIMLCIKGKQYLNRNKLKYGISNNIKYYEYLLNKNKELINKVPIKKKIILIYDIYILNKLLKKSRSIKSF